MLYSAFLGITFQGAAAGPRSDPLWSGVTKKGRNNSAPPRRSHEDSDPFPASLPLPITGAGRGYPPTNFPRSRRAITPGRYRPPVVPGGQARDVPGPGVVIAAPYAFTTDQGSPLCRNNWYWYSRRRRWRLPSKRQTHLATVGSRETGGRTQRHRRRRARGLQT